MDSTDFKPKGPMQQVHEVSEGTTKDLSVMKFVEL